MKIAQKLAPWAPICQRCDRMSPGGNAGVNTIQITKLIY